MKLNTNILILNPGASKPYSKTWSFECEPEQLQTKVQESFNSNPVFQGCKLKGISRINRTDGPNEVFPGTVFFKLNQFLICWI